MKKAILFLLIIGTIVGVKFYFFTPPKPLQYDNLRLQIELILFAPQNLQQCSHTKTLSYVITNDSLYCREEITYQYPHPDPNRIVPPSTGVAPINIYPLSTFIQEEQDGIFEVREIKKAFSEKDKTTLDSLILLISRVSLSWLDCFGFIDDNAFKFIISKFNYHWENDLYITTNAVHIMKDSYKRIALKYDIQGNKRLVLRTLPYKPPKEYKSYSEEDSVLTERKRLSELYFEEDVVPHQKQFMKILMSYKQYLGKPRRDTLSFGETSVFRDGEPLEDIFKE